MAERLTDILECRIADLQERIRAQPIWRALTGADTPPAIAQSIMREVYLEIVWYQPDVIEATIATIGQMPRSLAPRKVRAMLLHQIEEWDHGEMALRDYVGLGGSERFARGSRPSPSAFAVAAYWRMLAHTRDPFAYLGALYLFEGLTPRVTGEVKAHLEAKAMGAETLEYIEFHSTEDIKHQNLVRQLIDSLADQPGARESMLHGLDCFEHVYPLPCWNAAYERALRGGSELGLHALAS